MRAFGFTEFLSPLPQAVQVSPARRRTSRPCRRSPESFRDFDGVGDDFAGDERILHAFAAHRDAVGNGDDIEDNRLAAIGVRAFLGFEREFINVHGRVNDQLTF